ncbi:MAG: hypothetical protein IJK95_04955 [Firmicutes bacterium]|nr:hypothetical protein [Bacillota bacterium]
MLRRFLTQELEFEKKTLARLKSHKLPQSKVILVSAGGFFYYKNRGEKKRTYIPRKNTRQIWQIASVRFYRQKIIFLEENISALEKVLLKLRDYDDESVLSTLPKVYRDAVEYVRSRDMSNKVHQSENPYNREDLALVVSNGLIVRSREELIIAELLISLGIEFWYEKALTVTGSVILADGSVIMREMTIYPDFTIKLADGTMFYWEHCGRLDLEKYRDRFMEKMKLYAENGIFAPARLLITTSGKGEAINIPALRDLVMNVILPRCKITNKPE